MQTNIYGKIQANTNLRKRYVNKNIQHTYIKKENPNKYALNTQVCKYNYIRRILNI